MANSYLKLDERRALKDGTYPVKIEVGHGKELRIATGVYLRKDQWDATAKTATNKRIASLLATILMRVKNTIIELKESGRFYKMSNAQLRAALTTDYQTDTKVRFLDVGKAFLKIKEGKRTRELYEATFKKIREFDEMVTMETIRPTWLKEFSIFLGGSVNGRAIHLRNIRAVFNYALDEEITQNYPFRKFKIPREETRKRSLSIEDLRALKNLDGLTKQEEEYRDMFMLIFYLIGINVVDLAGLTAEKLVNGRIEYKRAKTGRLYSIKVEPEAMAIIERYRGERKLLAPFERYTNYRDYNHRFDDALKKLGPAIGKHRNGVVKRTPINADLSSYWARHTWATVAASIDVPNETIAAGLGHSYGNRTTAIYIAYDSRKVDEANRRIIDYLMQGDTKE